MGHQNSFSESENILFTAEIYNDSYQKMLNQKVQIDIYSTDSSQYSFQFHNQADDYFLNAGHLRPGVYAYNAFVIGNDQSLQKGGTFIIHPDLLENTDTKANFGLLRRLAQQNGGKMYTLEDINSMVEDIKTNTDMRPVIHNKNERNELLNNRFLFLILIVLISFEWFIRKYSGTI